MEKNTGTAGLGIPLLALRAIFSSDTKPLPPPTVVELPYSSLELTTVKALNRLAGGLSGLKKDAFLGLAHIGLAFESLNIEPMGSRDLDVVYDYVFSSKRGVKVSYAGFGGNSKSQVKSWETDAIKFRGRGILHFTGRNAYESLGLADKTNSELDALFRTPDVIASTFYDWFNASWNKGGDYPGWRPFFYYAGYPPFLRKPPSDAEPSKGWLLRAQYYKEALKRRPITLAQAKTLANIFYNNKI